MWKNIRKGAKSFFGHVLYAAGEGFHIRFQHDPWSSPSALKVLHPALFAIAVNKEAMVSEMVDYAPDGGGRSWNLRFHRAFQDQETEIFYDFFAYISSKLPRRGDDTMIWQLNHSGVFDVHSFYTSLLAAPLVSFPWKSIWCVKVPKRVTFFLWTAARGGLLTIDNLVKKKLPLVNWCCLRRCKEETVDHLLIHCKYAYTLWSEVLRFFGVQWVMQKNEGLKMRGQRQLKPLQTPRPPPPLIP